MLLLIWKPRKQFLVLGSLILLIYFTLGPLDWRHVDDWGVNGFFDFYANSIDLKLSLRALRNGWGTYPPAWSLQALFSAGFGQYITAERYFLIFVAWIVSIFISIGTYSCVLNIFYGHSDFRLKNSLLLKGRTLDFAQSVCLIFASLNMQIFAHSASNMPYQLPALTTTLVLLMLTSSALNNVDQFSLGQKFWFIELSEKQPIRCFFLLSVSLSLGFQTILLLPPLVIMVYIKKLFEQEGGRFSLLVDYRSHMKQFYLFRSWLRRFAFNLGIFFENYNISRILLALFSLLFLVPWGKKLIVLYKKGASTGEWAFGVENIYNLSLFNLDLQTVFYRIPINVSKIFASSLYAGRFWQTEISFILLIVVIASFLLLFHKKVYIFSFYILLLLFELIALAVIGKVPLTPTRHLIYIFPSIWIVTITALLYSFQTPFYKHANSLIFALFVFKSIILFQSHQLISYKSSDLEKTYEMAIKADYYPWVSSWHAEDPNQTGKFDSVSEFAYNSTKSMNILNKKACKHLPLEPSYAIFAYSHRVPLIKQEGSISYKESSPCVPSGSQYKVLEKIEIANPLDIEQDNAISNGGSSLFAYLIRIKPPS